LEEIESKAIILAAGKGERLQPLTDNLPKCMVKLFGKSLLEWQINAFKKSGINNISVITGYKGESIKFPGIRYFRNPNYEDTNMVETLFCAKEQLEGSVIVSYGDIIFENNILQKLINSERDISVVIDKNWKECWETRFEDPLEDAESLIINDEGNIVNIGQKVKDYSEIQGQYVGLMKFQNDGILTLKNFYNYAKNESKTGTNLLNPLLSFKKSYMTDLIQGLINAGYKIKAIPIHNGWLEVDTIQDYELYNKLKNENKLKKFIALEQM